MGEPKITKEMLIGDIMREYPESIKVFQKHFRSRCYDCPGSDREDVEFGSIMHGADLKTVLKELNEIAEKEKTMKVSKEMIVNDCIKLYPKTIGVFTQFKIDSCCGGAVSIEAAAKRDGADIDEIMKAIEKAASK